MWLIILQEVSSRINFIFQHTHTSSVTLRRPTVTEEKLSALKIRGTVSSNENSDDNY